MAKRENFDPRAIPGRAFYDQLMTGVTDILGTWDSEKLAELQRVLREQGQEDDEADMLFVSLANLGFCAVIDNMADIIEQRENDNGKA